MTLRIENDPHCVFCVGLWMLGVWSLRKGREDRGACGRFDRFEAFLIEESGKQERCLLTIYERQLPPAPWRALPGGQCQVHCQQEAPGPTGRAPGLLQPQLEKARA